MVNDEEGTRSAGRQADVTAPPGTAGTPIGRDPAGAGAGGVGPGGPGTGDANPGDAGPGASGSGVDGGDQPAPGAAATAQPRRRRRRSRWLVEWGVVLVVALVVAVLVRTYVLETFFIPSGSMEPTLMPGDRIVVDKLSFHIHRVYRGDIVVFRRPPAWPKDYQDLVKRVIGMPGETISASGGNVYIDGRLLREPWLHAGVTTANFAPVQVPAGDYFMMGDNRGDSADSRFYGPVPGKDFVGQVVFRYWPLSRLGSL